MIDEYEYQSLRPTGAPPLLKLTEVTELCWNGWLDYTLKPELQNEIVELQETAAKYFMQNEMPKALAVDDKISLEEGYYNVEGEKEYITYRRSLDKRSTLESQVSKIWPQIATLLHRMLCDLSRAGNLPTAAWDSIVKGALTLPHADCPLPECPSFLRLFRYAPLTGISDKHTDLGILTLCFGIGDEGLEVLDRQGFAMKWTTAPKCTILVGQSLRAISSDHIRTGVHRVVATRTGRQSLVFALRPNMSATVNLRHFGGHGTMNMKEMFLSVKGSRYNVNAKREVREEELAKSARAAKRNKKEDLKEDEEEIVLDAHQKHIPTLYPFKHLVGN